MEMKDFMTAEQVAKMLNLNYYTVIKYAKENRLPAVKIGRKWIFNRGTLEDYLKQKTMTNVSVLDTGHGIK